MKKVFFLVLLGVFLFSNGAFADCNGDTDKFSIAQWCIDSQDTLIPSATAGQKVIYETVSNTATSLRFLATQETGKVITDIGNGTNPVDAGKSCGKYMLPRASVGLTYTLSVGSRCFATLDTADTSDTILYSISGTGLDAGDSIKSTGQAGDSVTVTSTAANKWSITQMKGVFTDNSTN